MARLNHKGQPSAAGKAVNAASRQLKVSATFSPVAASTSTLSLVSPEDFKRILDQTDIQDLVRCRDVDILLSTAEKMILGRADMSEAATSHGASGIERIWQLVADYERNHPAFASKIEHWRLEVNYNLGEHGIEHWLTLARDTRKRITSSEGELQNRWHVSSMDILDSKYYLEKKDLSKGIMQNLAQLSRYATLEEGRTLLLENIDKRCRLRARPHGMSKDEVLTLTDAASSVKEAKKRKASDDINTDVKRPRSSRRKLNTSDSTSHPSITDSKPGLSTPLESAKGVDELDTHTASPGRQHQDVENDQGNDNTTTQSHNEGEDKSLQASKHVQTSDEHLADAPLGLGLAVRKQISQEQGDCDEERDFESDSLVCDYILNTSLVS
jgi:hypothetical protein